MNAKIADILKDQLTELSFVDKLAGLVKPITYTDKAGNEKTFPVAVDGATPCDPMHYTDLVPDSSKLSIIYFEDQGMDVINSGCRYVDCETKLKLVCWCNLAKINADIVSAELLKLAIMMTIPTRIDNTDWVTKIFVKFEGEETKSPDIFGGYTYDEKQNQYLMYPYDYFALNYSVKYSIPMNAECIDTLILNPKLCI
jgi:hypothetical protein